MLTYSRSKGTFAGLTPEGAVVEQDNGSTRARNEHAVPGRQVRVAEAKEDRKVKWFRPD